MHFFDKVKFNYLFLIFGLVFTSIHCNTPLMQSLWRETGVPLDSDISKWNGMLNYSNDSRLGIGAANDAAYLYLCLTSDNKSAAFRAMRSGLKLTFTGKCNKGKVLGIHFPIGGQDFHLGRAEMNDTELIKEKLEASFQAIEIIGPKAKDSLVMKTVIAESYGITVKVTPFMNNFIYELKVPLHTDSVNKYAIDPGKDSIVKVSLDFAVPHFPSGEHHEYGSGTEGGHHHGGGMGGGGMGGMGGGGGGFGGQGGGFRGGQSGNIGEGGHTQHNNGEMHTEEMESANMSWAIKLAGKS